MHMRPHAVANDHVFEARESQLGPRQAADASWLELDSVYLADGGGGPERVARLCRRPRRDRASIGRSFAILGSPGAAHVKEEAPIRGGAIQACGRQYSLALLALLDALAAEPARSPLSPAAPLDDLRATAVLVAGAAAGEHPDTALIDRAVRGADRRLVDLRVPLRATGYLAARDALRQIVAGARPAHAGGP